MAKKSFAGASADLFKLLEPFNTDERHRMVKGTLTLLGDADAAADIGSRSNQQHSATQSFQQQLSRHQGPVPFDQARKFLDTKSPHGTSEKLASAARFFETHGGSATMHKADFKAVFEGARRDFTASQFARDMDNAIRSGYFNAGGGRKSGYTLSHYGQDYVDALPNRATAKAIERPKRGAKGRKKGRAKAATT